MKKNFSASKIVRKSDEGFTLVELLVVVVVLALLAVTLLPALASQSDSRAFRCLNNQKQIMQAWRMYAEDNGDLLPPNDYPYTTAFLISGNPNTLKNWVVGTMEQPFDATASSELIAPQSLLSAYITNAGVYQCPADEYIDPNSHKVHVRSVSMNSAVGTLWNGSTAFNAGGAGSLGSAVVGGWLSGQQFNSTQTAFLTYGKFSSIVRPSPANLFVLIDESPYSINDGSFVASAIPYYLVDYPASYHNGGATLSFADGHAETHRWVDPRTTNPVNSVQPGQGSSSSAASPGNQDTVYLSNITSAAR